MPSVTQDWLHVLPYMQQTVLLELTRGPDTLPKYHKAKFLMRWVRRCILVSAFDGKPLLTPYAFGGGSFTGPSYGEGTTFEHDWRPEMDNIIADYLRGVDEIPHHFHLHLVHGIEILGYKHPDEGIRKWWESVYIRMVHDMHLWPETESQLDDRLGDNRDGWLKRADPATVA